jgi:catechol 2,3-dioxygenase-like lactoylglutathione lyase family enzyme
MLSHVSIAVRDLVRAAAFYDAVLGALGYGRIPSESGSITFAASETSASFTLHPAPDSRPPHPRCHVAFDAATREAVRGFHSAALAHGGHDDGPPGLRLHYGPNYYAAFAIDADGYRIEAVCLRDGTNVADGAGTHLA